MFEDNPIIIYSDRDRIRNQMIKYMKNYLELDTLDLSKSEYMSYLTNVLSGLSANLLYYNSSIYREFFLTTAITKEAILNLSAMLGYQPPLARPATVPLLIAMDLTFTQPVTIRLFGNNMTGADRNDQVKPMKYYAGSTVFVQDNKVEVKIGVDTVQVSEVDRNSQRKNLRTYQKDNKLYFGVNATQIENQTIEHVIPEKLKSYEYYTIPVNYTGSLSEIKVETRLGAATYEWEYYGSMFLIPRGVYGYTYRLTKDGLKIFFGNGVIGQQPNEGSICTVTVGTTKGIDGNVLAGTVNRVDRIYVTYKDENGDDVAKLVSMNVLNTEPARGGEDAPTIDEIRAGAIANVSSMSRLVTHNDFLNIGNIVTTLPIRHPLHIMKRSDLKRNETVVFTDLVFGDNIVPIRNHMWDIRHASQDVVNSLKTEITIDDEQYYSLFNIICDFDTMESKYWYYVDQYQSPISVHSASEITYIVPETAYFTVVESGYDRRNKDMIIRIYYDPIEDGILDFDNVTCELTLLWNSSTYTMTKVYDVDDVIKKNYYEYTVSLVDVPQNEQIFIFTFYNLNNVIDTINGTDVYETLNRCQAEVVVKKDLSDFMFSQIRIAEVPVEDDPGETLVHYRIYDVPVILKNYYDSLKTQDKNLFTNLIFQKLSSFDVINYRMLTDFVNIKFSDSYGYINNMKFNKVTRNDVHCVNPETIPTDVDSRYRCIVTDEVNAWSVSPWYKEGPFIAEAVEVFDSTTGDPISIEWLFERVIKNDILNIIFPDSTIGKYIFTGRKLMDLENMGIKIPFDIRLIVWKTETTTLSNQAIITKIKNKLVDVLSVNFGYDKPFYMNKIVELTEAVPDVLNCELLEPESDIIFNYDIYKDFTQLELLEYSPNLIYFDTTRISIEIR